MNPDEAKRLSRGASGDMSPEAIRRRIEIAGELYDLWRFLRRAERIGPWHDEVDEPRNGPLRSRADRSENP